MKTEKDYTKYSFRITFLVIATMLAISLVPPFSIGGVHFKRANILSDIITFEDDAQQREGELTELDRQFLEEAERRGYLELETPDPVDGNVPDYVPVLEHEWEIDGADMDEDVPGDLDEPQTGEEGILRFSDYTSEGRPSVADFAKMMQEASRTRVVRIAFFGDSYVEGDIITADIREQLQELYGGQGVGFVPFGNPLAISRPTVAHTFEGWHNYNLIYKKNSPEELHDKFFMSGTVSVPEEDGQASSHFRGMRFRKHIGQWSRAKLLFISDGGSVLDIAVNDSIRKQFHPDSSAQVQQINLSGSGMRSLDVRVSEGEGFVGYGVVLDGARGVAVDNYAVRSNSGIAFFGTDRRINTRIGRMLGYDLIVLQWGLNAMDPTVTNYNSYGISLRRVINYVKSCFPQSTIVVMGVGDRATQRDGEFVTMEAVRAMIAVQKAAAEECGVAFWNTFEAMGGEGSMARFVERQWAAKDYMHLSYGGGRHIARRFVQALLDAKNGKSTGDDEFAGEETGEVHSIELDLSTATETAVVDSILVDSVVSARDSTVVTRDTVQQIDEVVLDSLRIVAEDAEAGLLHAVESSQ